MVGADGKLISFEGKQPSHRTLSGAHSWVRKSLGFTMDGEQTGTGVLPRLLTVADIYLASRLHLGCRRQRS